MANMPGSCPAEWVDDRVMQLKREGKEVHVISGCYALRYPKEIKHYRIPSVSIFESGEEYYYAKKFGSDIFESAWMRFYLSSCNKLSKLFKFAQLPIFRGEGNWFWVISACLCALYLMKKNKYQVIYSTGGPASSHIAGIIATRLFFSKIIVELQDPLTGQGIGRNNFSSIGLNYMEKFIIKKSHKVAFVTKTAMEECRKTYPMYAHKIDYIYPGSLHQFSPTSLTSESSSNRFESKIHFTYTGSLYGSRNLNSFLKVLSEFEKNNKVVYDINILGSLTDQLKEDIKTINNKNLILLGRGTREEALDAIKAADVLLLVQHEDDRSTRTIPFKVYDYLNSGKLIFGLLYRNSELKKILSDHGHLACEIDNKNEIKKAISKVFNHYDQLKNQIKIGEFTTSKATKKMYKLFND